MGPELSPRAQEIRRDLQELAHGKWPTRLTAPDETLDWISEMVEQDEKAGLYFWGEPKKVKGGKVKAG